MAEMGSTVVCSIISRGIVFQLAQLPSCGFSAINDSTSLKHWSVQTANFFQKGQGTFPNLPAHSDLSGGPFVGEGSHLHPDNLTWNRKMSSEFEKLEKTLRVF